MSFKTVFKVDTVEDQETMDNLLGDPVLWLNKTKWPGEETAWYLGVSIPNKLTTEELQTIVSKLQAALEEEKR